MSLILIPLLAIGLVFAAFVALRRRKKADAPTDAFSYAVRDGGTLAFPCGHRGPKAIVYDIYGTKFEAGFTEESPHCADCCIEQMRSLIIRCAVCGRAIMPGEVVHLLHAGTARLEWTTRHAGEMILCNRADCEGGNPSGRWTGETVDEFFR